MGFANQGVFSGLSVPREDLGRTLPESGSVKGHLCNLNGQRLLDFLENQSANSSPKHQSQNIQASLRKLRFELRGGGKSFHQALGALNPSEVNSLVRWVGPKKWKGLVSISGHRSEELFWDDLYSLGGHLQGRGNLVEADQIFSHLAFARGLPNLDPEIRKGATEKWEALRGQGTFANRMDFLSHDLLYRTFDYKIILPIMLAHPAYLLGRGGALARLARAGRGLWYSRGLPARALAAGVGFVGEVGTFTFLEKGLHQWAGHPMSWDPYHLGEDYLKNFVTLGLFKFTGWAGNQAFLKTHGLAELGSFYRLSRFTEFSRHGVPAASMYLGLAAAQGLHQEIGWSPKTSSEQIWLSSAFQFISLNLGMKAGKNFMPRGWDTFQRQLGIQAEIFSDYTKGNSQGPGLSLKNLQSIFPNPFRLAPEGAPGGEFRPWMAMVEGREGNKAKKPPLGIGANPPRVVQGQSARIRELIKRGNFEGIKEMLGDPGLIGHFFQRLWIQNHGKEALPKEPLILSGRRMKGTVEELALTRAEESRWDRSKRNSFYLTFKFQGGKFLLLKGGGRDFFDYARSWFQGHMGPTSHPVVQSFLTRLYRIRGPWAPQLPGVSSQEVKTFLADPKGESGVSIEQLWNLQRQIHPSKAPASGQIYMVGIRFGKQGHLSYLGLVEPKVAARLQGTYEKFPYTLEKIRKTLQKDPAKRRKTNKFSNPTGKFSDFLGYFSDIELRSDLLNKIWESTHAQESSLPSGDLVLTFQNLNPGRISRMELSTPQEAPQRHPRYGTKIVLRPIPDLPGEYRLLHIEGRNQEGVMEAWLEPYLEGFPLHPLVRKLISGHLSIKESNNVISQEEFSKYLTEEKGSEFKWLDQYKVLADYIGESLSPSVSGQGPKFLAASFEPKPSPRVSGLKILKQEEASSLYRSYRLHPLPHAGSVWDPKGVIAQVKMEKDPSQPAEAVLYKPHELRSLEIPLQELADVYAHPREGTKFLKALWQLGHVGEEFPAGESLNMVGQVSRGLYYGLRLYRNGEGKDEILTREFQIKLYPKEHGGGEYQIHRALGQNSMTLALAWLRPYLGEGPMPTIARKLVGRILQYKDDKESISTGDLKQFLQGLEGDKPNWVDRILEASRHIGRDNQALIEPGTGTFLVFTKGKPTQGGNLVSFQLVRGSELSEFGSEYFKIPVPNSNQFQSLGEFITVKEVLGMSPRVTKEGSPEAWLEWFRWDYGNSGVPGERLQEVLGRANARRDLVQALWVGRHGFEPLPIDQDLILLGSDYLTPGKVLKLRLLTFEESANQTSKNGFNITLQVNAEGVVGIKSLGGRSGEGLKHAWLQSLWGDGEMPTQVQRILLRQLQGFNKVKPYSFEDFMEVIGDLRGPNKNWVDRLVEMQAGLLHSNSADLQIADRVVLIGYKVKGSDGKIYVTGLNLMTPDKVVYRKRWQFKYVLEKDNGSFKLVP